MIVKNLLLAVGVVGVSTAAAAADASKANWQIGGKIRMDNVQSTDVTTPAASGAKKITSKDSEISLNTAQFTLTGTQGADSMVIKFLADKSELDTATISHKFTDMISTTFGKMTLMSQGFEVDYDAIDQYVWSMAGQNAPSNATGARVDLSFGDHSVAVQAVQGLSTITSGSTTMTFPTGGRMSWALQYRGQIAGMIRPLFTYTKVSPSSSLGTSVTIDGNTKTTVGVRYGNGYQTQMGVGAQVDIAGATVDVEMDTVTFHKQTIKDTTEKDSKISSMIVQAKYPFGATTGLLKFTSDSHKFGATSDVGDITQTQIALGAEHKLDATCRLHAIYSMGNASTKATASESEKVASNGFNFGVTASM